MDDLYCCMCGSELHNLTTGGVIKGDWIDFIDKNLNLDTPVICWFCCECWTKMREIRNR